MSFQPVEPVEQPIPQVRIRAREIQDLPGPTPPDRMGRLGAALGAGIGFGGAITYGACWLLFQLAVRSSGAAAPALMPQTARWVTSLLVFLVYGTVSSVLLGAVAGALDGVLQSRTWKSQNPLLAWVFGLVIGLVITLLVHLIMAGRGFHAPLAIQLRFVTIPSMIFVVESAVTGVLIRYRATRRR